MQMSYARLGEYMHRRMTGGMISGYSPTPSLEQFQQVYDDELAKAGLAEHKDTRLCTLHCYVTQQPVYKSV